MQDRCGSGLVAEDLEVLAVAQTIFKSISEELETAAKGGQGMRARADLALLDAYERGGVDRVSLGIAGVKVGTMTLKVAQSPDVVDADAFDAWMLENGHAKTVRTVRWDYLTDSQRERLLALAGVMNPFAVADTVEREKGWEKRLQEARDGEAVWKDSGELVPGVRYAHVHTGTTLKVDMKKAVPLLAGMGGTVGRLLGVGFDNVTETEAEAVEVSAVEEVA